jgi:hypothetical protein
MTILIKQVNLAFVRHVQLKHVWGCLQVQLLEWFVSEFTLMLVPNLANRFHWLYHYTIWSRGSSKSLWVCLDIFSTWYAAFSCDATSTATHPANCDVLHKTLPVFVEAAKLSEQHYECVLDIRLMNAAQEWQQYSQTVASNMTTLYCEGGLVFVLAVNIHAFVAVVTIGTIILKFSNSAFCPYSVLLCHWVLTIHSDYFLLHFLTFIMDIHGVFCEVDTALLNVTQMTVYKVSNPVLKA